MHSLKCLFAFAWELAASQVCSCLCTCKCFIACRIKYRFWIAFLKVVIFPPTFSAALRMVLPIRCAYCNKHECLRAETLSFPFKGSHSWCSVASPLYSCASESFPCLPSAYTVSRCWWPHWDVELETKVICWIKTTLKYFLFVDSFEDFPPFPPFPPLSYCNTSSLLQISLVCICFPSICRPKKSAFK